MAKLQIRELDKLQPISQVIIHSIDWMIYQVSVVEGMQTRLLYSGDSPFRCHNLLQIKELFQLLDVSEYLLERKNSAYDEMIGQPAPLFSDCMRVHLPWKRLVITTH